MGEAPGAPGAAAPAGIDREHIVAEQRYLDGAYRCLEAMTRRTSAAADDAAWRSAGDWDATVAQIHLTRRLASMDADAGPLCFGRIDEDGGPAWHIGRRHVEDTDGDPVVVDWRAPVAVPFYRATFRDPLGLRRRRRFLLDGRRLSDVLEEDFADPEGAVHAAASGLPDPLLAELGRARTGSMQDIVATIAAEQDRIIRAPLDVPVVVQGGPGTGKTAVGLHRAAFLLYEHRVRLEREGVLVLGPNRLFLAYVADVLPSLGEVAVVQTTLGGLVPQWPVAAEDPPAVAALKGDGRMAAVLARAARLPLETTAESAVAATRWGAVRLGAEDLTRWREEAWGSGGPVSQRRTRFRRAVVRAVTADLGERRAAGVLDPDEVGADLGRDRRFQTALGRLWPAQSATALVRSMLGRSAGARAAFGEHLDVEELRLLGRRRSGSGRGWSAADLALLDEADHLLGGAPRRYGHVVVDEAQDLSPMALRMVARRCLDGRSMTVLGDLAQATAPGAPGNWDHALSALGAPVGARVEELATGYRVPAQIMEQANALLAATAPGLRPTTSVRRTDDPPVYEEVGPGDVAEHSARAAAVLLRRHPSSVVVAAGELLGRVADALDVLGTPAGHPGHAVRAGQVSLLRPEEVKGLEFDAVVIAEPGAILAGAGGAGLLYIALTRAVQHLSVVHSGPLPPGLGAASDGDSSRAAVPR
jgi:DNA helicase IV